MTETEIHNGRHTRGAPEPGRLSGRFQAGLEERFGRSADKLRRVLPDQPDIVVVTGSGMNTILRSAVPIAAYSDLPEFPRPSVVGHSGTVYHTAVEGRSLLVYSGRIHLYEGADIRDVVAPIAVAALLGVRAVLLLNSAGGLQPGWRTGDIMLIADTVNMTFRTVRRGWLNATPLRYSHPATWFHEQWRRAAGSELVRSGIAHREGTYMGVVGPCYETPAEVRCYRRLGGQAIGMSTVLEAEFAHVCGLDVAGCSLISNTLSETKAAPVSHEEVLFAAQSGVRAIEEWIRACCRTWPQQVAQ